VVVYVTVETGTADGTIAWAAYCALDSDGYDRPIAGQINYMDEYLTSDINEWDT
jgi:hypothetical protein